VGELVPDLAHDVDRVPVVVAEKTESMAEFDSGAQRTQRAIESKELIVALLCGWK
jgi:hypothetical protein